MKQAFRVVGYLEALSFVLLVGVAMPLKYFYEMPAATKVPGMAHGLLFILYVFMAMEMASKEQWPKKKLYIAWLASLLPFGTVVFDRKFLSA